MKFYSDFILLRAGWLNALNISTFKLSFEYWVFEYNIARPVVHFQDNWKAQTSETK